MEFIKYRDAHGFKLFDTAFRVIVGIIVRDVRHTHLDSVRVAMLQKPFQILQCQSIVFSGIGPIDVGVHILDVNDETIQNSIGGLNG